MPKKATAKRPDAGAPCPIMHSCGGCAWLGLPYRKQLAPFIWKGTMPQFITLER